MIHKNLFCFPSHILKFVLIFSFFMFIFIFFNYFNDYEYLDYFGERNFEIASECFSYDYKNLTQVCYSVTDLINFEKNIAKRKLLINGQGEAKFIALLIQPNGFSTKNSDTRLWEIDHLTISLQYIGSMIISPFILGALDIPVFFNFFSLFNNTQIKKSIMVIGMGSGILDMYFHKRFQNLRIIVYEKEPIVNFLAKRWFGVQENLMRQTILKDGVIAIKEASKNGLRFNAVFIDACNYNNWFLCPDSEFLKNSTLQNIQSILTDKGAVVINVLSFMHNETKYLQKVYRQLLIFFPTCIIFHFTSEFNTIFSCVKYAIKSNELNNLGISQKHAWLKSYNTVVKLFNFDVLLNSTIFEVISNEENWVPAQI